MQVDTTENDIPRREPSTPDGRGQAPHGGGGDREGQVRDQRGALSVGQRATEVAVHPAGEPGHGPVAHRGSDSTGR